MASAAVLSPPITPAFPSPSIYDFLHRSMATFALELPHAAAYADHRVQKDTPHNHKAEYAIHPNAKDNHAKAHFKSLILTKDNVVQVLSAHPDLLEFLIDLAPDSWKVSTSALRKIEQTWTGKPSSEPEAMKKIEDDYLSLNMTISHAIGDKGVTAENLSVLAISHCAWDVITRIVLEMPVEEEGSPCSTFDLQAYPADLPYVSEEILLESVHSLRNPDYHSHFLKKGAYEIRSLTSHVPSAVELVPRDTWYLPTMAGIDDDDDEIDDTAAEDEDSNEADAGKEEEKEEDDESQFEIKACLIPDDDSLVKKVLDLAFQK